MLGRIQQWFPFIITLPSVESASREVCSQSLLQSKNQLLGSKAIKVVFFCMANTICVREFLEDFVGTWVESCTMKFSCKPKGTQKITYGKPKGKTMKTDTLLRLFRCEAPCP